MKFKTLKLRLQQKGYLPNPSLRQIRECFESDALAIAQSKIEELETELGHLRMAGNWEAKRDAVIESWANSVKAFHNAPEPCPCGCGAAADLPPIREIETESDKDLEYLADVKFGVGEEKPQYRILDVGDVIQKGDEVNYRGGYADHWTVIGGNAEIFGKTVRAEKNGPCPVGYYRRPLPEYRMLKTGAILKAGDEWLPSCGQWTPVLVSGNALAPDTKARRPIQIP